MESLIFAINAVAPIVIMVAIGYLIKTSGLVTADFAKTANRIVFRVFLPAMLFLNVYKIEDLGAIDIGFAVYAVTAVVGMFLIFIPIVSCFTKEKSYRGVLLQTVFRSNYALVGIPLSESLFGEEGIMAATLLSAIIIPVFNALAVVSLSANNPSGGKASIGKVLLGIAKNPLIDAIALGLITLVLRAAFVKNGIEFRLRDITPVYTALEYLSRTATPLALVALGAQFEFSSVTALRREIAFGVFVRNLAVPAIGLGVAYLLFANRFTGAHFATFVSVFTTPVAVSSVPMAQEMGGDTTLAGQIVVWTTLISALSIFAASFLLKAVGIF